MGKDLKGKELGAGLSQCKDGRYRARFTNSTGRRKEFKDKKLAVVRQWLRDEEYKNAHGISDNEESCDTSGEKQSEDTAEEALDALTVDAWFEQFLAKKRRIRRASTVNSNACGYKCRIKDSIGNLKLTEVTTAHIDNLLDKLKADGYKKGTIVATRNLLADIFARAVDDDLISKSPVPKSSIPSGCLEEEKIKLISPEDKQAFKEEIKGHRLECWFQIAMQTGMRTGEISALTPEDINFKDRHIYVTHTLSVVNGKEFYINNPKTRSGRRKIPISDSLEAMIRKQIESQKELKRRAKKWNPIPGYENLLFSTYSGKPLQESAIRSALLSTIDKINKRRREIAKKEHRPVALMPPWLPHCFRHTFASECVKSGVLPNALCTLLGHSDISITLEIYTHFTEEEVRSELKKLSM